MTLQLDTSKHPQARAWVTALLGRGLWDPSRLVSHTQRRSLLQGPTAASSTPRLVCSKCCGSTGERSPGWCPGTGDSLRDWTQRRQEKRQTFIRAEDREAPSTRRGWWRASQLLSSPSLGVFVCLQHAVSKEYM